MTVRNLEPVHRFHCYSARFPSEIAETAIQQYTRQGDSVYDPFCGSGTSLVAAIASRRIAVGSDIDLLAGILSDLKCFPRPPEEYAVWKRQFSAVFMRRIDAIESGWSSVGPPVAGKLWTIGRLSLQIPGLQNLSYWFPPQVIGALAAIADLAHSCADQHFSKVILATLSACVIAKWPNTLSYAMDIDHTRPHRCIQRISLNRVRETFLRRLDRTVTCLGRIHDSYRELDAIQNATVLVPCDARNPILGVEDCSQKLIVTSPPYFNAIDYPRAHRLSLCWMNGFSSADVSTRKNYLGIRGASGVDQSDWSDRHRKSTKRIARAIKPDSSKLRSAIAFFADLECVLKENWRVLRKGGHAVYVIANNVIANEQLPCHLILKDLACSIGFEHVQSSQRPIKNIRRRFPVGVFGFDGPMTREYVVVFKKPRRVRNVTSDY